MNWEDNRECVESLAGVYDFSIDYIQPWHLRLSLLSGKRLDYFPKSGRATWVSSGKWFTIEDIEQFIQEQYDSAAS